MCFFAIRTPSSVARGSRFVTSATASPTAAIGYTAQCGSRTVGRGPARVLADELQDLAQTQIPAAQNVALTAPAEP